LFQELIQFRPGLGLRDDLLPPLIALLRQQKPREVSHLDALGLGQLFKRPDEFLRIGAHGKIVPARPFDSIPSPPHPSAAHEAYVLEVGAIAMSGKAGDLLKSDEVRKAYLGVG